MEDNINNMMQFGKFGASLTFPNRVCEFRLSISTERHLIFFKFQFVNKFEEACHECFVANIVITTPE